jgi:hypothetical protein
VTRAIKQIENLLQGRDRRLPASRLGPQRLDAPGRQDADGLHAHPLRAGELVVRAVADEHALVRAYVQPPARELVDPRIGLRQADGARQYDVVDVRRKLGLVPELFDIAGAHADHAALEASPLEVVERLDRTVSGYESTACEVGSDPDALGDACAIKAEPAKVLADRADLALLVRRRPDAVDVGDVTGELSLDVVEGAARPESKRVPEVEDHRAHSRSTSHARATSASVVRAFPIASRRT